MPLDPREHAALHDLVISNGRILDEDRSEDLAQIFSVGWAYAARRP